jgi:hypothetical protein
MYNRNLIWDCREGEFGMAIDPLGTPEPVRLATMPLAAARQAVRLTSEQNQQLREAGLRADERAQESRDARAAAEEARAAEARQANDTARNGDGGTDTPAVAESRGERLDIFA